MSFADLLLAVSAFAAAFGGFGDGADFAGVGVQLFDFFQLIWDFLRNTVIALWRGIITWLSGIWDFILDALRWFGKQIGGFVDFWVGIWNIFVFIVAQVFNVIVQNIAVPLIVFFQDIWTRYLNGELGALEFFGETAKSIWRGWSWLVEKITEIGTWIQERLWNFILDNWDVVFPVIIGLILLGAAFWGAIVKFAISGIVWLAVKLGVPALALALAKLLKAAGLGKVLAFFGVASAGVAAYVAKNSGALLLLKIALVFSLFSALLSIFMNSLVFDGILGFSLTEGFASMMAAVVISMAGFLDYPAAWAAVVAAQVSQFINFIFYMLAVDLIVALLVQAWAAIFVLRRFRVVLGL